MKDCCKKGESEGYWGDRGKKGIFLGIVYGILPHSFCIAFVVFSVLGATMATPVFKKALFTPYFFQILVGLSLVFATASAALYLRRNGKLSLAGARGKWRYLSVLYGTTIAVNLFFFFVVFPWVTNARAKTLVASQVKIAELKKVTLEVQIPCSGHAPLIIDELNKISGIHNIIFRMPNFFDIDYDPQIITPEKITFLKIFTEFNATIVNQ